MTSVSYVCDHDFNALTKPPRFGANILAMDDVFFKDKKVGRFCFFCNRRKNTTSLKNRDLCLGHFLVQ